jgi:amidophosphoribosyltransferase
LCRACFDGEYPTQVPDAQLMGQQMGEITPLASLVSTLPSAGGGPGIQALDRP